MAQSGSGYAGSRVYSTSASGRHPPRLLMNLILIRGSYPPIAVRPEDRPAYIRALQRLQAGLGSESFDNLLYERLDATLGEYLNVFEKKLDS
jgi:Fic family protein